MLTFELDITCRQTELNHAFGDLKVQRDQEYGVANDLQWVKDHINAQLETAAQEIRALEKELVDLQVERLSLEAKHSQMKEVRMAAKAVLEEFEAKVKVAKTDYEDFIKQTEDVAGADFDNLDPETATTAYIKRKRES